MQVQGPGLQLLASFLGAGYLLSSPGAVCSHLTMFGHGGLSQMETKGRFPGDRGGLGAQASCWSSGGLFWAGAWGTGS